MTHNERHIVSAKETHLTSRLLMSSPENDRVRAERVVFEDGVTQYTVTSKQLVHREEIARIMARPIGFIFESGWQDVMHGLSDVAYPSNQVRRAATNSTKRAHLKRVRGASLELASILRRNQPYFTTTVKIPAYSASESMQYVNKILTTRESAKNLLSMLISVGLDSETATSLTQLVHYNEQSADVVRELILLTGMSEEDIREAENTALFAAVEPYIWTELVYRRQEQLFTGFLKATQFQDGALRFGTDDPSLFVLDEDVPDTIRRNHRDVVASLGRKIRSDKKSDEQRYEVTFYAHDDAVAALPRVVWETDPEGKRRFVFPTSTYEKGTTGVAARPSSMLGAAVVANYVRDAGLVSYSSTLMNRLFRGKKRNPWMRGSGTTTRNMAGFLPLVIDHHERTALGTEYFSSIEDALQ